MREPLCIWSRNKNECPDNIPVSTLHSLDTVNFEKVAFLVLDISDWQRGFQQLRQVRNNTKPDIYLKPILFYGSTEAVPREVLLAADGIIKDDGSSFDTALTRWTSKLESVNRSIDLLQEISVDGDLNIAFKVLRLMESRNMEFTPLPSARNTSGYVYPSLQPLFPKKGDVEMLETLEYLEDQKLIRGEFVSRAYACTHCGCAFLNFIETCPDCNSADLDTEELIHHFKCAYVGVVEEYRQNGELVCPKCEKKLKHIGADYDKASVVYKCNSCSNIFQEPEVTTSCYGCWRETSPENQIVRTIQSYTITSLGQNAARHGMDSLLQTILTDKVQAISYDVFKEFFRLEVARIERYKVSTSCLVIMRLDGIDQIYGRLGKRATELFLELSGAFKAELRSSDLFCVRDETIFLSILTETSRKKAEVAVSRLGERVQKLLSANLKMEFQVDSRIVQLSAKVLLEESIESFLQTNAA